VPVRCTVRYGYGMVWYGKTITVQCKRLKIAYFLQQRDFLAHFSKIQML